MTRPGEIRRQLDALGELRDIVRALRSVAAARVRQAESRAAAVAAYERAVEAALAEAFGLVGAPARATPERPLLLVVACSEHGFVGGFDDRLLGTARQIAADELWILGTRGARLARERGMPVALAWPMATRTDGVVEAARSLAEALYRRLADGRIARVDVLATRRAPAGIERRRLVPPDADRVSQPSQRPFVNLAPAALLEAVIPEHVLAVLVSVALGSFAAENAARLRRMIEAHDHLGDRLDTLRREARRSRQDEITAELLDLVGGTLAVLEPDGPSGPLLGPQHQRETDHPLDGSEADHGGRPLPEAVDDP